MNGRRVAIVNILVLISVIILAMLLISSCDSGGGSSARSSFIGAFTMETPGFIAMADERPSLIDTLFSPVAAYAMPNLGNKTGDFTGAYPLPENTQVFILGSSGETIDSANADATGRVRIDDVPVGFLKILIIGGSGKTWSAPTHLVEGHSSYMRAVLKKNAEGKDAVYAKTVHDDDATGTNIDAFSLTVLGRPVNIGYSGIVLLHKDGKTYIDNNGDGDFTDTSDQTITEADDDGISSDAGDGDEDNDGITDNHEQSDEDDIDGDGITNANDPDDDGDGIVDTADTYPRGITPLDDFTPPALIDPLGGFNGEAYSGIDAVQPVWQDPEQTIAVPGKVIVFFPGAEDKSHNDISYRIYYYDSTFDFTAAPYKVFHPVAGVITDPGELYDFEISGLVPGVNYSFAVRALDSAPPPNMDDNTKVLELELPG